ncbi:MAG: hypothetical protein HN981_00745, partial [Candidatus Pacebacteria bacterium]|nr:hypothetical protein [Candidatus Paceibacterota bacterium]
LRERLPNNVDLVAKDKQSIEDLEKNETNSFLKIKVEKQVINIETIKL